MLASQFIAEHPELFIALHKWIQCRNARVKCPDRELTYEERQLHNVKVQADHALVEACENIFLHHLDKVAPARDGISYGN